PDPVPGTRRIYDPQGGRLVERGLSKRSGAAPVGELRGRQCPRRAVAWAKSRRKRPERDGQSRRAGGVVRRSNQSARLSRGKDSEIREDAYSGVGGRVERLQ